MLAKRDKAKLRYAKNNEHLNEANKQISYLFRLKIECGGGGGAFVLLPRTWMHFPWIISGKTVQCDMPFNNSKGNSFYPLEPG